MPFMVCTVLILFFLSVPRIGTENWQNGIYESLVIIVIFPLIVYLGASGEIKKKTHQKNQSVFRRHFIPFTLFIILLFTFFSSYVVDNKLSMIQAIPSGLLVIFTSIAVAYLSLKIVNNIFKDILLEKWFLTKLSGKKLGRLSFQKVFYHAKTRKKFFLLTRVFAEFYNFTFCHLWWSNCQNFPFRNYIKLCNISFLSVISKSSTLVILLPISQKWSIGKKQK